MMKSASYASVICVTASAFGDSEGIISNLDKQINKILGVKND